MKQLRLALALLLFTIAACGGSDSNPVAPPPPPLPNYTGVWSGGYTVTSCTQNGDLTLANICGTFSPGASAGFQLNIIQQGTAITAGNFTMGTVPFNVVPAPLTSSGGLVISGTSLSNGITILVTFNLTSPIVGTLTQVWSASGATGQVNIAANIGGVTKVGSLDSAPLSAPQSVPDVIRAVRGAQ